MSRRLTATENVFYDYISGGTLARFETHGIDVCNRVILAAACEFALGTGNSVSRKWAQQMDSKEKANLKRNVEALIVKLRELL